MTHLYIGTPGSVPFNPGDYWMPRRLNVTNLQVVKTEDKPADPTEFKIRRAGTNGASYGFSSARTMSFSDADSQSAYRSIAASSVLTKSLLNAGENLNTVYAATEAGLKDGGNDKA